MKTMPPPQPPHIQEPTADRSKSADALVPRLELLEVRLKKSEDRADILAAALAAAKNEIAALQGQIKKSEGHSDSLSAAVACSKNDGAVLRSRLAELEAGAVGLGAAIDGVSKSLDRAVSLWQGHSAQNERQAAAQALSALTLDAQLFDRRLKRLETGLEEDLKKRFAEIDGLLGETARKAGLASEMGQCVTRRAEKLDAAVSRFSSLENRLAGTEEKLKTIYDIEALSYSLKLNVDGMGKNFEEALRACSQTAAGNKKLGSDFEALSRQVLQLSALFNQLRTELAFLLGRNGGGIGG